MKKDVKSTIQPSLQTQRLLGLMNIDVPTIKDSSSNTKTRSRGRRLRKNRLSSLNRNLMSKTQDNSVSRNTHSQLRDLKNKVNKIYKSLLLLNLE